MHKTFFKHDVLPAKKPKKAWRPGPRKATGERAVFEYVWMTRPHRCAMCPRTVKEPLSHCFAHQWGKGTHGGERLDPNNIVLVCSQECHAKVDALRHSLPWPSVKKTLQRGRLV